MNANLNVNWKLILLIRYFVCNIPKGNPGLNEVSRSEIKPVSDYRHVSSSKFGSLSERYQQIICSGIPTHLTSNKLVVLKWYWMPTLQFSSIVRDWNNAIKQTPLNQFSHTNSFEPEGPSGGKSVVVVFSYECHGILLMSNSSYWFINS